jgi:dienelactone hydrolase
VTASVPDAGETVSATSTTSTTSPPNAEARSSEVLVARVALGLIALHVADDSFLQPEPGTSAGDHVVGGLVPLAVLGLAAWGYPRLRAGLRATVALFLGGFGVIVGIEGAYTTVKGGPSGDDFTGLLAIPAGLVLIGLAVVTLWRSRKRGGGRVRRYGRRALLAVAGVLVAYVVVLPFYLSYVFTHAARGFVPTPELGAAHEEVSFTTSDGLVLKGWYIPSKNRAAVIAFPGRKGPQRPARMLARHGYGVLLFDRRGEGVSEGDPNLLGWQGERDIRAAIAFLQSRPDVDPERIGAIGLSVGGEMLIEAAAESEGLAAVVSEGAGIRSLREALAIPETRKKIEATMIHMAITPGTALFSSNLPPESLEDLSARIAPTPVFFIYAVPGQGGEAELTETFYEAAQEPKEIWLVPGATHTGGIEAQPEEYERRVVGFFDDALLSDEGREP